MICENVTKNKQRPACRFGTDQCVVIDASREEGIRGFCNTLYYYNLITSAVLSFQLGRVMLVVIRVCQNGGCAWFLCHFLLGAKQLYSM